MIFRLLIGAMVAAVLSFIYKRIVRTAARIERKGAKYIPDDSKWADVKTKYGVQPEYPIVGNDPDKYFGSLATNEGKGITWKALPAIKQESENFDFEKLAITPYLIFVDEEYEGKLYFHVCDALNTKLAPEGYKLVDKDEKGLAIQGGQNEEVE